MAVRRPTKRRTSTPRRMLLDPVKVAESTLDLARQRVSEAFDRFDMLSVHCSGGKDSSCVLHLVMAERERRGIDSPLDVVFYDEEAIPYETEHYVRQISQWPGISVRWLALPITRSNATAPIAPTWYPWAPEDEDIWCRPMPPESITYKDFDTWDFEPVSNRIGTFEMNALLYDVHTQGRVGIFMGIRAEESMTRKRAVLRRMEDNWIVPYIRDTFSVCRWPGCMKPTVRPTASTCEEHFGKRLPETDYSDLQFVSKLYPIYDWTTQDVWTFTRDYCKDPVTGETAYNKAYDQMEMAGIPHAKQRCAPPFGQEQLAGLWVFKVAFPELWAKMVDRVPGAATAERYGKTELYAYRTRPRVADEDWWDDDAWKRLIQDLLRKHPARSARLLAEQLELFMHRHNEKTNGDPILPDIPHPVTGLSWQWLASIALRGDAWHRKKPEWQVITRDNPAMVRRYRENYREGLREWLNRRST